MTITKKVTVDVAIIGAGWAGISAANALRKQGSTSFKILEARGRIGGRSHTVYLNENSDIPVDLGSAWIHGRESTNPIQKLIEELKIPHRRSQVDAALVLDSNGHILDENEREALDQLETDFMKYQAKRQDRDSKDTNLAQVKKDFMKKMGFTEGHKDHLKLEYLLDSVIATEYAAPLDEMSLYWWNSDLEFDGDDNFLGVPGGGYSKFIETFAAPVQSHVQLQSKVTRIDYGKDMAKVTFVDLSKSNEEMSLLAKHVLVTLPLGVLKAGTVKFSPSLPKPKLKAINNLGYGVLNKCIMFWENMEEDHLPWPKDGHWLSRVAGESSGQGIWTDFYNPYNMNGGKPVLIAFAAGTHAKRIEKLSDQEVTEEAVSSLRIMFGENIPEPSKTIVTRWEADEFSRGSYSFQKVGSSLKSRKDLEQQVAGKLWFAGEATHKKYPSTTHGAMMSGEKAAGDILTELAISAFE